LGVLCTCVRRIVVARAERDPILIEVSMQVAGSKEARRDEREHAGNASWCARADVSWPWSAHSCAHAEGWPKIASTGYRFPALLQNLIKAAKHLITQ
jgi:hypothetical protein